MLHHKLICIGIMVAMCRHPKAWWGQDPWRMLSDLCTPGLCIVAPPAPSPVSASATQPTITQPAPSKQNLANQLQLQQEEQQVAGETNHICKLQVLSSAALC